MSSEKRLKALDALLLSLTDEDGMLLSEFDGFCAGLIVCPEIIPPSEWLPEVWGSNGPIGLDSDHALQSAIDLIMGHYNEVTRSLIPPEFEYGPVLEHDSRTDETLWETWVSGFEHAMSLRPDAWAQIVESDDEEAGASVSMMLTLHAIVEGDSDLPESTIADLQDMAPDLITDMVIALNRWTKGSNPGDLSSWGGTQLESSAPVRSSKVGRNDPCPCGSGRKYKRCCGAN
ncbi:UPF0149 family protein [Silicimonas sp. MF1-12-2]|uniref:UPF0149 family protein n=1 Tax=Silicimonas sp. MF1-12-2 TaxID=3384793 RepID=UPI0039B56E8A